MTPKIRKENIDVRENDKRYSALTADGRRELFEAIRNGDELAFAEYYNAFVDPLVGFLKKILGNGEEAKEIAQDVFIKLWENRREIDPEKKVEGFIYTTAKNMAFNLIKRKGIHSRYHNEQLFTQEKSGQSPDEDLISKEMELLIRLVVNNMPPQRRRAFELSRNEELTYEEIALRMGVSHDTVKSHIKQALKDIREAVGVFLLFMLLG